MRVKDIFILGLVMLMVVLNLSELTAADVSDTAVKGLVKRLLPERYNLFEFKSIPRENGKDVFELKSDAGRIVVSGSTPLAMASGFNWYLKHVVNCQVSWCGDQLNLPDPLPPVKGTIRKRTSYTKNFYFNYCTHSYTMAWWDWKRWEREIDYMALCGINMPLAITGAEAIWLNFLKRFGYTDKEAKNFICGPGYFAWWLMGNLEGRGGPLSDEWIAMRVKLQKKILKRMREFGMHPVLPGFVGLVPSTFSKKMPGAKTFSQGRWGGGKNIRPYVLSPEDPMFEKMAGAWYEEMDKLYGKIDSFAGDLFHEGGNAHGIDVAAMAADVQKYMLKYNPESVWCVQGWGGNPRKDLLSALKKKNTVVVELCCEFWKHWERRHGFEGTPWIFSTVIMYGGNVALHGRLDSIADNLQEALTFDKKNAPVGLGATWESIDENPVVMDFIWDMLWREKVPDIKEWIKAYSVRRYGVDSPDLKRAWVLLLKSAYKGHPGLRRPQETVLCARPSLNVKKVSPFSATIKIQYDPKILKNAVGLLLKEADKCKEEETYQFDAVDMTRQFVSNTAQFVYYDMVDAFRKRDKKRFNKDAEIFLQIFNDQDRLLGTEKLYLLGHWLDSARKLGPTPEQSRQNELNARLLITVWNNQKSGLRDYAWREWNGMLKNFYKPRWEMFITRLRNNLDGKKTSNFETYPFEIAWAKKTWQEDSYITEPEGDPVATSVEMYKKYSKVFDNYYHP